MSAFFFVSSFFTHSWGLHASFVPRSCGRWMVIFYYGTSLCCAFIALLCKEQGITVLGVNLVHAFVCEFIAEEIRTSCEVERKENVNILNNDNRIGNNNEIVDVNHEVKARSINFKKTPGTDICSSALGTGTDSIASNGTQKNHQGQEDNGPLCVGCGIKPASCCLKCLKRGWCASCNEEEGHDGSSALHVATGLSAASSEERVACDPVNIENQSNPGITYKEVLPKKKVSFILPSTYGTREKSGSDKISRAKTHRPKHIDANNARSRRQKESLQRKNNKGEDSMLKPPTEQSHLSAGHVRFRRVFISSLHTCAKTQGPYVLASILNDRDDRTTNKQRGKNEKKRQDKLRCAVMYVRVLCC